MTDIQERVHKEVDHMTDEELLELKKFLATYPDRLGAMLRNAPWDDEPFTEEQKQMVIEAEEWFERNGGRGIPHDEILRRHGLT